MLTVGARRVLAHRYAWQVFTGTPPPEGMMVLHHCDVRHCVNPAHLFLGNAKTNADDAMRKGRMDLSGLIPGYKGPRGPRARTA